MIYQVRHLRVRQRDRRVAEERPCRGARAAAGQGAGVAAVARAGDVVSREELRDAVWGADTHVDFDRGIAYCLSQIRTALGDSGDNPRFVQTIPKRGFKFIAPGARVRCTGAQACTGSPAARCDRVPATACHPWQIVGRASSWRHRSGLVWLVFPLSPNRDERVVIAVSVFDNETGSRRIRSAGRRPLGPRRRASHEDRSRSHRRRRQRRRASPAAQHPQSQGRRRKTSRPTTCCSGSCSAANRVALHHAFHPPPRRSAPESESAAGCRTRSSAGSKPRSSKNSSARSASTS